MPRYYECGICGCLHPWNWNGDCRDDENRFDSEQLDRKHGAARWECLSMDDRVTADAEAA